MIEVVKTLAEAMVLVILVMFVFLQSWRATLIPGIAIPVVLLGTFGMLYILGFSINTLTLFGLVLSVGLLVDDAIVVVENVERILEEQPDLTVKEATVLSMSQIQTALIAIALVLSAVFLPMVFFGGSTGVIYRQFSATIVSAMALSVLLALTFSPSLAANVLRRKHGSVEDSWLGRRAPRVAHGIERARHTFNDRFQRGINWYVGNVGRVVERKWLFLAIYAGVCVLLLVMFWRLPTGFIPSEDQGNASVQFRLPAGATFGRTQQVEQAVEKYYLTGPEKNNVHTFFAVTGGGGGLSGQNTGQAYVNLAPFGERKGSDNSAQSIVDRSSAAFRGLRDAQVFALVPGAIRGLGQSAGFTVELQNTSGMSRQAFAAARDRLLAEATTDPILAQVRLSDLPDVASLKVNIDVPRLSALGLTTTDVNSTLSTAWGGRYVNDFIDRGRVKRVFVQGDAPYRSAPSDLDSWFVRNNQGQMVPFSSFAETGWTVAPVTLSRFEGFPSYRASGPGSAGQELGPGDGGDRTARGPDPRHQHRLVGRLLPGADRRRTGPAALRDLADRDLPVPRGALRKLVDPARGVAGGAARPGRRDPVRDPARARERRVPPDRAC